MQSEKVVYPGKDLEAMSFAVNYHHWILDEFKPFLGKKIVEVGAGTGSFSKMLLETEPETLTLVEPSEMYEHLTGGLSKNGHRTEIEFYNSVFAEAAPKIAQQEKPDSIIYVNVLEHVEDDRRELELIYNSLETGGRCLIFVPALEILYGDFDKKLGHFRRYRKDDLEKKCLDAGFKILKSKYFDFVGVFPWYIKYRLLNSDGLSGGAVTLYDKLIVPVFRNVESIVRIPFGKNILLVGEK